jgi:hypothetical protein
MVLFCGIKNPLICASCVCRKRCWLGWEDLDFLGRRWGREDLDLLGRGRAVNPKLENLSDN